MVDRHQEQSRVLAETSGTEGRAARDLALIVAVSALIVAAGIATKRVDAAIAWADDLPPIATTVLAAILALVAAGAGFLGYRRYLAAERDRAAVQDLRFHDPLTSLPNRNFLGDEFDAILREARRTSGKVAVLFIDLDGFKRINDIYGFSVGDQLMKEVADRIKAVLGPRDNLVRYGGDEFVVLCPEVTNATSAERITKSIIKAIEAPIEHDGDIVQLSASIGIALTEERCSRPDEVLRDADAAMYQAKALGPGRYALFDRSVRDQITPAIAERRLRQALENGEFRLYYQPIVSLWTKRLVGVEALLRWSDPDRGMVRPEEFVPALEETGLIVPIGNWIINEVCKQSREWTELYPDRPPLNIKFNVSARQLAQANFVEHVRSALAASGAAPERICLEVTEEALMHDVGAAWPTLQACKQLGVSLALDEFGTGFSSLAYLRQLNLDLLTIDKSFVDELTHSRKDAVVIEHVIGMAKALGIVTVAEGVETEEQVGVLRSLNCDLAQGYYFSHPQPPDVIAYLMERHANRQEWRPPHKTDEEATHAPSAPVVVLDASRQTPNDTATADPDDGSLPPRRTTPTPR